MNEKGPGHPPALIKLQRTGRAQGTHLLLSSYGGQAELSAPTFSYQATADRQSSGQLPDMMQNIHTEFVQKLFSRYIYLRCRFDLFIFDAGIKIKKRPENIFE